MKYLFINGSPHKGNTWKLAESVKSTLSSLDGNASFEEIHLSQLNLPFCTGCSNCFRLGHEKCPHFDKVGAVISAIDNADGVIFASTTYNMSETSLLRNLFDHLCFMLHRPYFFKSKALVLTTTGGVGGKSAAKSICSKLTGIGFNRCYFYTTASFSWNCYKPTPKTITALSKIAKKFHEDVSSEKLHSPTTLSLIPYNLFRGMSLAYTKGSEYATFDGDYWTQDIRKNTIYDASVKVPFYKKPFGHLFYVIGKFAGRNKDFLVTYKK